MRWLLLLFIISPVILFGQVRRKAVIDAVKAAGNVQDVATEIGKSPDAKVERIHVADSGEYVTIMIRVRVADDAVPALLPEPVVTIKMSDIVVAGLSTRTVPDLPPFFEGEPLALLGVTPIGMDNIVLRNTVMKDVPAGPPVIAGEPTAVLEVVPISIGEVVARSLDVVSVPPVPELQMDADALTLSAEIKFAIAVFAPGKMNAAAVPVFEERKPMPVTGMHLSDKGYSLLEKMEGFSPELYALGDGGLTIGFGFFVPFGEERKWEKGVTWDEAELMMKQKVPSYEDQVKKYINVPLTQEEFDALTMMAYNLGGFAKATSIVNDINGNADFEQLQKDWMRFVHSKAPGVMKGLINRRKDEIAVTNEAYYQPERKIQILKYKK